MSATTPRPHPKATEQPALNTKLWFSGIAVKGLTTDRVFNRPVIFDGKVMRDANTGAVIESELRGWYVRDEDMRASD